MIYVVHGEDLQASYLRASGILKFDNKQRVIRLDSANDAGDLYLAIFSEDFFNSSKLIFCEDFIKDKKISAKTKFLTGLANEVNIVFWEKGTISGVVLKFLLKIGSVEEFKTKPHLFWFLDSLSNDSKKAVKSFVQFKNEEKKEVRVLWNLSFRLLLLIVAKLGGTNEAATLISQRTVFDWQWAKIKAQADHFDLSTLLSLYEGSLKLDFATKRGKTDLSEEETLPLLLLKYLR